MFEATRLTFYYAVTPIHMGAGSAIGAIDNPIQREVHTQHPMFSGSGIKGALRHHFARAWPRNGARANALIERIFGPETNSSDYAGALSLSDAQLVLLPVRALKGAFVYATCSLALARLRRLADLAEVKVDWEIPPVTQTALTAGEKLLARGCLVLESFEFSAQVNTQVKKIAEWLSTHAFHSVNSFFAEKLRDDLVLLSDTDFAHFARHAMVVEPHVRINDESGTADDGGLFYTENVPPESLLAGLAQASVERFKKGEKPAELMDANKILDVVFDGAGQDKPGIGRGRPLQIGADATSGRGLVLVKVLRKETEL